MAALVFPIDPVTVTLAPPHCVALVALLDLYGDLMSGREKTSFDLDMEFVLQDFRQLLLDKFEGLESVKA